MQRRHRATLQAVFRRPVSGNIRWADVEAMLMALGAEIGQRRGSRVVVIFPGQPPAVFHRPHPSPHADKGAIARLRDWLASMDIHPDERSRKP